MRLSWLCTISLFILFIFIATSFADESLQLVATISLGTDSTSIASVNSVGDFNADGFEDLLVGIICRSGYTRHPFEAAYLFYGGPQFDTVPDLIFLAPPQDTICIHDPWDLRILFGANALRLDDFNGDGFDDMAIGAPTYCNHSFQAGRIYIYFGGSNPDTSADLIVGGERSNDVFGESMASGDFNGDGLNDLLAVGDCGYEGAKFFIYLGADSPDTISDWLFDCTNKGNLGMPGNIPVSDINGDGYDDFGLVLSLQYYPYWDYFVFLGGDSIGAAPIDSFFEDWPIFTSDISGDGIDDMIITHEDAASDLCIGEEPLNFDPDYPMGQGQFYNNPFIMDLGGGIRLLATDNIYFQHHDIQLFNLGIPFDTIPYCALDYGRIHSSTNINIGDINGDGIGDLSFEDTSYIFTEIYTIVSTGINEHNELPEQHALLSAYPNPFNSSTVIIYSALLERGEIAIYNSQGQLVKTFKITAKEGKIVWDATDSSGKKVSSGIYFARASNRQYSSVIKLIYLK